MSFDHELAQRVLHQFESLHPFIDKKMFGGLGIMINGNMCVGVIKDNLVVRVGKKSYLQALQIEGVSEFDFTGKPITGWVYVDGDYLIEDSQLLHWLNQGLDFALTLDAKPLIIKSANKTVSKATSKKKVKRS